MTNKLFFGDNLGIMRSLTDESVDLIYLDPPFNSQKAYNVFFPDKTGSMSSAQIHAFEDTWTWSTEIDLAFDELLSGNYSPQLKDMTAGFRKFLGTVDLMAYLVMMTIRLVEMHRILKPNGSLYLHCDPTACHYLKIVLDHIFGFKNFRNEVIWKRTSAHNDPRRYGSNYDTLLFYSKSDKWTWNDQFIKHGEVYSKRFRNTDTDGRAWSDYDLSAKGLSGGGYEYEYKGTTSLWRVPLSTMKKLDAEGRLHFTSKGGIRLKRYLDDLKGTILQALWDDIPPINSQAKERIGYPTQKPLALLERIIRASTNKGDTVLDPFCGCGTAIVASEMLSRNWIGIDITYLAVYLIKKRLFEHFPDVKFSEFGQPSSFEDASSLAASSKSQFEAWAVTLIGGQPYKSSGGGDGGVDGLLYFKDFEGGHHRIIIEVKGGDYHPKDLRALAQVMNREGAPLGVLIALREPTKGMRKEATALGKWTMPGSRKPYPVLQIITIQDYFAGRLPVLPDTSGTLRKAPRSTREREKKENQPKLKLDS